MSLDYRPDFPPIDPGTLTLVSHLVPEKSGQYRTPYTTSPVTNWSTALHNAILGSRMVQKADGTPFVFFGNNRLEEWNGVTLSNVSKGGGSPYTLGSRWWFCQFGDVTVASNFTEATQSRSGATGTAFADLTNAPKARIFLAQQAYLLALNYDDGAANPAGVKWASQGTSTTWTAATGNTAGNATLRETPGAIVAGAEFNDIVVVWKRNSMYLGRVVGGAGTDIWRFQMLSPSVGCVSQEAWVSTPVGIIFVSPYSGVFRFDGSSPQAIDRGIRQEIYRNMRTLSSVQLSHDEASATVFLWMDNGVTQLCYAYNYVIDKWGKGFDGTMGATSGHFGAWVRDGRYDDYITLGGDTDANRRCHLVVDSSNIKVFNLSDFTTNQNVSFSVLTVRDPKAAPRQDTHLDRVNVIFGYDTETSTAVEAASGTLTITPRKRISGGNSTALTPISMNNAGFDVNADANCFNLAFDFSPSHFVLYDVVYETSPSASPSGGSR